MKTLEEKRELFLDMQDHPENYSEQELQAMLDDPEMADDIKAFELLRQAELRASLSEECGVRSEELNASSSALQTSKTNNSSLHTPHSSLKKYSSLYKIAAMFIGIVMLGGIAYAAVRMVTERTATPIAESDNEKAVNAKVATSGEAEESTKTIAQSDSIVKFEDEELETVVNAMAAQYGISARFDNEAAKHIHIFLIWNKNNRLEDIIAVLNGYDRINVSLDDKTLIVK